MKLSTTAHLTEWLTELATLFKKNEDPTPEHYSYFLQDPLLALQLVDFINALDEVHLEEDDAYFSACIFALEICVAQLQMGDEGGNKLATKTLDSLMAALAAAITLRKHTLSFWLPILNAFYEVHVELSLELKNAYLDLACDEDELTPEEEASHLHSIQELIQELSDLSIFDVAENFFAQSYAMPPDFFTDLVMDLYSIEEGKDIALLTLMHPKQEVRDVVVAVHEALMHDITLSSASLSRLQAIKHWYPPIYHDQFNHWIKLQRKKGVVFNQETKPATIQIKASEVDGSGAQGLFIHLKRARKHRLCGLLLKQGTGIKDAWITPIISTTDIMHYYDEAFEDTVSLRAVDLSYVLMITNHFLALTVQHGGMPDLHFLEIQEELGVHWVPGFLDINALIDEIAVQISPFTEDTLQASFKRSKAWPKNKRFTESWFIENAQVDKVVNRCCHFIEGVKVCQIAEAIEAVLTEEMELHRDRWTFHFLWIALWVKSRAKKTEKIWQDSFFIAHAIHTGIPLKNIPILHEIAHQSVLNSIETMQERRTYLN